MEDISRLVSSMSDIASSLQQYSRYSVETLGEVRTLVNQVAKGDLASAQGTFASLSQRGQFLYDYTKGAMQDPSSFTDPSKGIYAVQQTQQQNQIAMEINRLQEEAAAHRKEIDAMGYRQKMYDSAYLGAIQTGQFIGKAYNYGKEKVVQAADAYQAYRDRTFSFERTGNITRGLSTLSGAVGGFFADPLMAITNPGIGVLAYGTKKVVAPALKSFATGMQRGVLKYGKNTDLKNEFQDLLGLNDQEAQILTNRITQSMAKGDITKGTENLKDTMSGMIDGEWGDIEPQDFEKLFNAVTKFKLQAGKAATAGAAIKDFLSSEQLKGLTRSIIGISSSVEEAQYKFSEVTRAKEYFLNRGADASKFMNYLQQGMSISQATGMGVFAGAKTAYALEGNSRVYRGSGLGVTQDTLQRGNQGLVSAGYGIMQEGMPYIMQGGRVNTKAMDKYLEGDYAGMVGSMDTFDLTAHEYMQFDPRVYQKHMESAAPDPLSIMAKRVMSRLKLTGKSSDNILRAIREVTGGDYDQNQALLNYFRTNAGNDFTSGITDSVTLRKKHEKLGIIGGALYTAGEWYGARRIGKDLKRGWKDAGEGFNQDGETSGNSGEALMGSQALGRYFSKYLAVTGGIARDISDFVEFGIAKPVANAAGNSGEALMGSPKALGRYFSNVTRNMIGSSLSGVAPELLQKGTSLENIGAQDIGNMLNQLYDTGMSAEQKKEFESKHLGNIEELRKAAGIMDSSFDASQVYKGKAGILRTSVNKTGDYVYAKVKEKQGKKNLRKSIQDKLQHLYTATEFHTEQVFDELTSESTKSLGGSQATVDELAKIQKEINSSIGGPEAQKRIKARVEGAKRNVMASIRKLFSQESVLNQCRAFIKAQGNIVKVVMDANNYDSKSAAGVIELAGGAEQYTNLVMDYILTNKSKELKAEEAEGFQVVLEVFRDEELSLETMGLGDFVSAASASAELPKLSESLKNSLADIGVHGTDAASILQEVAGQASGTLTSDKISGIVRKVAGTGAIVTPDMIKKLQSYHKATSPIRGLVEGDTEMMKSLLTLSGGKDPGSVAAEISADSELKIDLGELDSILQATGPNRRTSPGGKTTSSEENTFATATNTFGRAVQVFAKSINLNSERGAPENADKDKSWWIF